MFFLICIIFAALGRLFIRASLVVASAGYSLGVACGALVAEASLAV